MEDKDIIANIDGLPPLINFPRPPEEYKIIRADAGEFKIEGEPDSTFNSASEAYDYITGSLHGNPVFGDLRDDDSQSRGGMYFEDGTNRLLTSVSFEDKLSMLRHAYANFLKYTDYYRAHSDDWVAAYQWLDIHPAFWHRNQSNVSHWSTDRGMANRWETIHRNQDGTAGVMFEHGGTVFPGGAHHYHDTDLDIYSSGLEQAFVDYARKVDEHFNLDGTRKPVGYGYDKQGTK